MKQQRTALIIVLVLLVAVIVGLVVAGCSWFQSEPEAASRFVVQATPAAVAVTVML
jgi:flagellar basal body-associated protein FliL